MKQREYHYCITSRIVFCSLVILWVLILIRPAHAQKDSPPPPWETGRSHAEDLEITLITVGPGPGFSSWFGHTGLGVEDRRLNASCIYNFGMYSYHPGIILELLFGRLRFWVGPMVYNNALKLWQNQDRDISVVVLSLKLEKRLEMAKYLAQCIKPENRYYFYKYYEDNCSTRVRDLIDNATDGQFKRAMMKKPSRLSFREHSRRFLIRPIVDFGLMYAMSHDIDKPITVWDEMFLPCELERNVLDFKYSDENGKTVTLVTSHRVVYTSKNRTPPPEKSARLWPWMLLWGFLASGLSYITAKMYMRGTKKGRIVFGLYQAFLGLSFGGAGLFLIFAWGFTDHGVGDHNENLFLVNMLTFCAAPLGLLIASGKERFVSHLIKLWYICGVIAALGIALKILPWFYQNNWSSIALIAPLLATTVYSMRLIDTSRHTKSERSTSSA